MKAFSYDDSLGIRDQTYIIGRDVFFKINYTLQQNQPGEMRENSRKRLGLSNAHQPDGGVSRRRAVVSISSAIWRYCRHSDLGWAASSPIYPDIIFGKDIRSILPIRKENIACKQVAKWHQFDAMQNGDRKQGHYYDLERNGR